MNMALPNSNQGMYGGQYGSAQAAPAAAQAPAGAVAAPVVRGFRVLVRRTGTPEQMIQAFSSLSFLKMAQDAADPQTLLVLNIESRDISQNPYLFSIAYFRRNGIDVLYSVLPNMSPKVRKLEVIKYIFNLLTLSTELQVVDMRHLYQFLEATLSDMNEYVSGDYQKLFSLYDSLQGEMAAMKKKVKDLSDASETLSKDNYDLKARNDELTLRLQSLERYSDSVLAVKIQQWLAEHNGEINLSEFAKVHGVSEARVEQVLNSMVSEGYLETRT